MFYGYDDFGELDDEYDDDLYEEDSPLKAAMRKARREEAEIACKFALLCGLVTGAIIFSIFARCIKARQ